MRAIVTMTGIITTTTGVLFRNAEASATDPKMMTSVTVGRCPALASAVRVSQSSAPVRTRAPMMRNIAVMVHGA